MHFFYVTNLFEIQYFICLCLSIFIAVTIDVPIKKKIISHDINRSNLSLRHTKKNKIHKLFPNLTNKFKANPNPNENSSAKHKERGRIVKATPDDYRQFHASSLTTRLIGKWILRALWQTLTIYTLCYYSMYSNLALLLTRSELQMLCTQTLFLVITVKSLVTMDNLNWR